MSAAEAGGAQPREMNFSELYLGLDGRIGRSTYWVRGVLPLFGVGLVIDLVDLGIGTMGILSILWSLVALWPSTALMFKRLHDRDKSGWWSALLIIPVIGWIWGLVEIGMLEGTVGPNRYGPDPIDRAGTPAGIVVRDERDSGRRG